MTFYWPEIVNIALYCTIFELFDVEYRDLEIWVRVHSRPFKLVPFESLGAVSYLPSTVTMAVSLTVYENSASKYSVTLKTGLGCSRSLKMAQFDRPYTTFYWSGIVNIALSSTVF